MYVILKLLAKPFRWPPSHQLLHCGVMNPCDCSTVSWPVSVIGIPSLYVQCINSLTQIMECSRHLHLTTMCGWMSDIVRGLIVMWMNDTFLFSVVKPE